MQRQRELARQGGEVTAGWWQRTFRLWPEPWALVLLITAIGFWLRLRYLLETIPFFDEYTTILAARAILERGLPLLPSGLFYEHGLLFSYVDAITIGLFGFSEKMARLPALFVGTLTIPLLYRAGRGVLDRWTGLLAAGILATAPEAVVWSGRARMYALAQTLVLLVVYWAYVGAGGLKGAGDANSGGRYRYLALVTLLAALLTQLATAIVVLPLLIGLAFTGWLAREGRSPWFWRRRVVPEGLTLGAILLVAFLVKRIGQPLGMPAYSPADSGLAGTLSELLAVLRMSVGLAPGGESAARFLARLFGPSHHFPLVLLASVGLLYLAGRPIFRRWSGYDTALVYLYIIFGGVLAEMVMLLEPWRRNTRYLVMALPLFYLLAAWVPVRLVGALGNRLRLHWAQALRPAAAAAGLALLFATSTWPVFNITMATPEPGYDRAFRYVRDHWQDGDVVLTMNTSASALYLGRCDYFAIQEDAEQFLLNQGRGPVDRWLGAPWLNSPQALAEVLAKDRRAWFVVDELRLKVYYRGDFVSQVLAHMDLVYRDHGALVFLSGTGEPLALSPAYETPLPAPQVQAEAELGGQAKLLGYDLEPREVVHAAGETIRLTLYWQALAPMAEDYTVFVHLRDANKAMVAQADGQPLGGFYPTSAWRVGEVVPDSHVILLPARLPPGEYELRVGMYLLATLERLPVAGDASGENAVILERIKTGK